MKISDIKCYLIESPAPEPRFRWRDGLPGEGDGTPPGDPRYTAYLKIETDAGPTGHAVTGRGWSVIDLTRRRFKSLIGLDPLLTERAWHEIWELDRLEEFPMYQLGLIDTALWDLKSKVAAMPLYQLLGGNDPRVPVYASTVTWNTMDEYERYIKMCADLGFTAFKLHAWGRAEDDAKLSRNLRKWVGDDADLMFDGSAGWDLTTALWFGRVLEEVNFLWYEEPMREFDLPSYAQLACALDIPVLAAETSDGCHWNAATWIQYRALDMLRTSAHYKGGITGALKVAHLAESFGMRAQVHGGGHDNLHLCAAIPNNDYYEELVIDEPQIKSLATQSELPIVDGFITAPDTPGIGPEPDWSQIQKDAVMTA
ncbi:MAG: racemase [Planctomycetaceae bacterium]|nr:racemase [Planctomycetaceae bacterium]